MKKILLMMVGLMASAMSFAQNEVGHWTLTPKVGVNLATLTTPDVYVDSSEKIEYCKKTGFVFGGEAEYQLNRTIGLSAGLLYSQQGTNQKDNSQLRDASAKLNYLNVPLTANYYFAPNAAFRIGLQAGWALSRDEEGEEEDGNGHWMHYDKGFMEYRVFDLSIPLGLSWNVGPIQLDARYNLGLTNASKYDLLKSRHRVIQFTVGYRFEL